MLDSNETVLSGTLASGISSSTISYADALENYRKNTDWWVIFDTFDLPNAKGSPLWISGRTGINVEVVNEALEGLTVLGLLKRSDQGFEKLQKNIDIPDIGKSKPQRIQDHALIARQVLNHLCDDSKGSIRHTCFASNLIVINDLYEKINFLILEAQEKSRNLRKEEIDNVYLASYTAVNSIPILNDGKGDFYV